MNTSEIALSSPAQSAPEWLISSLKWTVFNSCLRFQLKSEYLKFLHEAPLTFASALDFQAQLIGQVRAAEEEEKAELRRAIGEVVKNNPEVFSTPWATSADLNWVWGVVTQKDISCRGLIDTYIRVKEAAELWGSAHRLVELAVVDSEKLQSQLRQALRDPDMTLAQEQAHVQQLTSELMANAGSAGSNYLITEAIRGLNEALLDSPHPKMLVEAMQQAMHNKALA